MSGWNGTPGGVTPEQAKHIHADQTFGGNNPGIYNHTRRLCATVIEQAEHIADLEAALRMIPEDVRVACGVLVRED
jgi:hypothetical protein